MIMLEDQNIKYKNIFAKGCLPNWPEWVFVIKKVKNTVTWTYFIKDFKEEEIVGFFYEKELQKTNQNEFRTERVIKRRGEVTATGLEPRTT